MFRKVKKCIKCDELLTPYCSKGFCRDCSMIKNKHSLSKAVNSKRWRKKND